MTVVVAVLAVASRGSADPSADIGTHDISRASASWVVNTPSNSDDRYTSSAYTIYIQSESEPGAEGQVAFLNLEISSCGAEACGNYRFWNGQTTVFDYTADPLLGTARVTGTVDLEGWSEDDDFLGYEDDVQFDVAWVAEEDLQPSHDMFIYGESCSENADIVLRQDRTMVASGSLGDATLSTSDLNYAEVSKSNALHVSAAC